MFDSSQKAKTTSFSSMKQLPLNGLYHLRNYSSDGNWLAYQVTLNEVRLMKFNENIAIRESLDLQFPPQPIKQIKVVADQKQDIAYMAVLFLTKYVIYKGNTQVCSYRLKLDKNIVMFQNSFVTCDGVSDEKSINFTFLTANGEIHTVTADNPANKSVFSVASDSRFCSIKVLGDQAVLGNEKGKLLLVSLINHNVLKQFNTGSQLPILQIKTLNQRIIVSTCQGEIFNFSYDFKSFTSLSAHQAMITQMEATNDKLYTFGDDGFLNVFEIDKNSNQLRIKKSQKYAKRANMIITLHSQTFLNFYEDTNLEQITQE